jgi:hypothetical protein
VVGGQVLNVTKFLPDHPGGELAILTFAGKDATEEFNMIHPPDVIPKYAPDAIIGAVGTGPAVGAAPAASGGGGGGRQQEKGSVMANHQAWGNYEGTNWRQDLDDNPGVMLINVQGYIMAAWNLIVAMLYEVCATVFSAKNLKLTNDRVGLTRSAIFLIFFIVVHAVGNLHVFKGPDDFNGYGYFYVRLYWTGFGLPANIVEEYCLLSALLHVFVGLKRTYDMKLTMGVKSGQLNLAISGLMLLTFMSVHLFQYRFGNTEQFGPYYIRPPTYLVNFKGILKLDLFWTDETDIEKVGVRDIYALEYKIFKNPLWGAFYICSVITFVTHGCLGWAKVTPALGIPRGHHKRVEKIGYAIFITLGLIYTSFPLYCFLTDPFAGKETGIQTDGHMEGVTIA